MKKGFDSESVQKYIKTKTNLYNGKMNKNFQHDKIQEENHHYLM